MLLSKLSGLELKMLKRTIQCVGLSEPRGAIRYQMLKLFKTAILSRFKLLIVNITNPGTIYHKLATSSQTRAQPHN